MTIQDYRCYKKSQLFKLALVELILFIIAFGLGFLISSDGHYYISYSSSLYSVSFIYKLLFITLIYSSIGVLCLFLLGLYKRHMNLYLQEQIIRVIASMVLLLIVLNNIAYWLYDFDVGKYVWLTAISISFLMLVICRTVFKVVSQNSVVKTKTIILGAGNKALKLKNDIEDSQNLKTTIIGYIYKPGERERLSRDRIVNIAFHNKSNKNELLEYCLKNEIDNIVVAVDDRRNNFPLAELVDCRQSGVKVIELMEFYESELGLVELSLLDPSWVIFSNKISSTMQYDLNKRTLDLFIATLLFIVLFPLFLVVCTCLKLTTGWSNYILSYDEKVGLFGNRYKQYRFNCRNKKSQISFIGKILVKLNLNYLPIILNILKGDISLVGPRAINFDIARELSNETWYFKHRNIVKPGIYSWGYKDIDHDYYKNYLAYDLFYIKRKSLLLDILILIEGVLGHLFGNVSMVNMNITTSSTEVKPESVSN